MFRRCRITMPLLCLSLLALEARAHEGAEVVGPDQRHEADARALPRQPHRHVARRAAEVPVVPSTGK